MAFKSYNTVNGMLVGEHDGERAVDYQTDALGSVVGTFQTNGTLRNTYRYAGYGQQVSKTGNAADPKFLWVGGWGYRNSSGMLYVRRRHLLGTLATWTSADYLWPGEDLLAYAMRSPTSLYDYSGLRPVCSPYLSLYDCLTRYLETGHSWYDACRSCIPGSPFDIWPIAPDACGKVKRWYDTYRPPNPRPRCDTPKGILIRDLPDLVNDFWYGQYCGSGNVKPPGVLPQDCIDGCCLLHDRCLGNHMAAGYSNTCAHRCCDCALADCAKSSASNGCCCDSPLPSDCIVASAAIAGMFSAMCATFFLIGIGCPRCLTGSGGNGGGGTGGGGYVGVGPSRIPRSSTGVPFME